MPRTLLSFVLVAALAGCSKGDSTQPVTAEPAAASSRPGKDPARARQLIAAGTPVVDVRTAEEWNDGHLPAAQHIPLDEVARRIADFETLVGGDKTRPLVVYCASGNRSGKAKQALEAAGFTNVVNGGGYDDLQ